MAASSSPSKTRQPDLAQHKLEEGRNTSAGSHLHPDESKQLAQKSLCVYTALSDSQYDLREAVEGDPIYPLFVLANSVNNQCGCLTSPVGRA